MQKTNLLYSGKAKCIYATTDPELVIVEYRDDATAFNGVKKATLSHKGVINNHINAFLMTHLENAGIPTHFVKLYSPNEMVAKKLNMLKVECVIRNISAGGLAKRLGIEEGIPLNPPIFEFFLKDDQLNDPMINDSSIITFNWASAEEIESMKQRSYEVNKTLSQLFKNAGLTLVDFKLEFGRLNNCLVLGDEITPDGCRIWDTETAKKLDKDRFRRDLGNIIESYIEVAERLGVKLPELVKA